MVNLRRIGKTDIRVSDIGLGTVSFGGLYTPTTQDMATEAVRAALDSGVNYFDTAPLYGYGASEMRLARALEGVPRSRYVISTKVGRVLDPISEAENRGRKEILSVNPAPNRVRDDYTRDGIMRSFESSMERLKTDHFEIVFIHYGDITPANDKRIMDEAYPLLLELRSQGMLGAIGMGMDEAPGMLRLAKKLDFDVCMLAFRHTLLDWSALDELFPYFQKKGVSVVIAAPYTGGILAMDDLSKNPKYLYRDAPPEVVARTQRIKDICGRHGVPLRAAALQFALGHPVIASTVPGGRNGAEVRDNVARASMKIPKAMWNELVKEGLLPNPPRR